MDCKKSDFLLDESVTYLNCAFMSPQMKQVEEAGLKGLQQKRNPFQITVDDFFGETDSLREEYAKLINAKDPNRIVVIPSVSYGMANVAKNLPISKSENIIVAGEQFPSNVYPWRSLEEEKGAEIITISPPDTLDNRGKTWNEQILDTIDSKTKMVALGIIHWADGTRFNLKAIRKRTKEVGAWLVIDGTQSVGALPFDIQEIEPDALICAGYKWLMGPYSIGLAYYGPALDEGTPVEENWINRYESENFGNLVNYNDHYQPGALRFEVGEHSNFILIPMLKKAVQQLNDWGVKSIQQYCRKITSEPLAKIRESGFWVEDEEYRTSHLFGIRVGEHHNMDSIKKTLEENSIIVSYRGDSIRVSPHVYNSVSDVEKLQEILTQN